MTVVVIGLVITTMFLAWGWIILNMRLDEFIESTDKQIANLAHRDTEQERLIQDLRGKQR